MLRLAAAVFALALTGCDAADLAGPDAAPLRSAPTGDQALWFGPGGSQVDGTLKPVAGPDARLQVDLRLDAPGTHVVLASSESLRLAVELDGSVAVALPAWTDGAPDVWTLASPAGAVAPGAWTRLEVIYDEVRLTLRVDGQTVAETTAHADQSLRAPGPVALAPTLVGAVASLAFTSADGQTVVQAATFDEGWGTSTQVSGLSGGTWALKAPRWVPVRR